MRLDRPPHVFAVEEVKDDKLWYYDIKCFLQSQIYPPGASAKDRKTLRRLSGSFYLDGEVLYKRNFDMVLLRCVDRHEADLLMTEVHEGSFRTHSNGHAMLPQEQASKELGQTDQEISQPSKQGCFSKNQSPRVCPTSSHDLEVHLKCSSQGLDVQRSSANA
ncbi:hypothetical protein KIW84_074305 [Lathyrus oleraceus]|uniref:Uncharacterized protein n=1 Tax=Pisum sativum TaxID=3888 RepID=A0A9D5A0A9_PEA|nr:hypothetical protein KIW84_074305 [Pisum sativum]